MKTDIETQLGAYMEGEIRPQQPITVAELQTLTVGDLGRPPRRRRGPLVAVASALAVLVLLGLVPLLISDDPIQPANNVPETTIAPNTAPPTTVPTENAQTSAPLEPVEALSWQRLPATQVGEPFTISEGTALFDGGDVMVALSTAAESVTIATSTDGVEWTLSTVTGLAEFTRYSAVWEDQLLVTGGGGGWGFSADGPGWASPSVVHLLRSDGSVSRSVFDGEIRESAMGAAGILVTLTPNDYGNSYGDIIDEVLGSSFTSVNYEYEIVDGVLEVATSDGRSADIVLADHGYSENAPKPTEWLSPNGEDWEPLAGTPGGDIVGTSDGFISIDGTTVSYSPDGRNWTEVGELDFMPRPSFWGANHEVPVLWDGGIIVGDRSGRLAHVSSGGVLEFAHPLSSVAFNENGQTPLVMAGDLGLIVVDTVHNELHVTSSGEDWTTLAIPEDITYQPSWYRSSGAVTAQGVVLWMWQGSTDESTWWLAQQP